jgi:hypothetical protein
MAKTVFSSGTKVLSTFLNAIFSHTHNDGVDDGDCSKIDLDDANEVKGVLPLANVETHSHNGEVGQMSKIDPVEEIDGVTEGIWTATVLDFSTYPVTVNIPWRKEVSSVAGTPAKVTLFIPEFKFTNAASTESFDDIIISSSMPGNITPSAPCHFHVYVIDNNNGGLQGKMTLNGTMYIWKTEGNTSFGVGLKGLNATTIQYAAAP